MRKLLLWLILGLIVAVSIWILRAPDRQGWHERVFNHDWQLPAELLHGRRLQLKANRYLIVDQSGDVFDVGRAWVHPDGDHIRLTGFALNMVLNLSQTEAEHLRFAGVIEDRFTGRREISGEIMPLEKKTWPEPSDLYSAAMMGDAELAEHFAASEKPNEPGAEHYDPKKPPHTPAILVAASYCHTELVQYFVATQAEAKTYDGKTYQQLLRESRCEHAVGLLLGEVLPVAGVSR